MSAGEKSREDFLARWSRRKREVAVSEKPAAALPGQEEKQVPANAQQAVREFDPSTLPPIKSLNALSDIRDFLRAGVPPELTRAALRRVWSADPAIRDFVGLAENAWDFTDPNAMPGFGPLEATDDVRRMVAQIMSEIGETGDVPNGGPLQVPESVGNSASVAEGETSATASTPLPEEASRQSEPELIAPDDSGAATQQDEFVQGEEQPSKRRTHGSALPH